MRKQHAGKCRKNINLGFNHDMTPAECDCDGYHTFTELYDHRITLFITVCMLLRLHTDAEIWKTKKHSDGSEWDGWFILGIGSKKGTQITYHLPSDRWDEANFAIQLEKAPEWDGHTSDDVIARLKKM